MSADATTVVAGYHDQVRHDVLSTVPRAGGTLVDVGGGVGATALAARAAGLADRVGTIDRVAKQDALPGLDFQHTGEIEDDAFLAAVLEREGPFDTILCLDVLEHLVDPWRLVAQLHLALAPGGALVASIPNVRHFRVSGGLFFRDRWTLGDAGILDRTHLRFFVRATAVELLTSSGLALEAVEAPRKQRHRRRVALFHALTRGRLSSLVDVQYVVRVRRTDLPA